MSRKQALNIALVFLLTLINSNYTLVQSAAAKTVTLLNPPDQPVPVEPLQGAIGVPTTATLKVHVTDLDNDNLTVSFYGRPKMETTGANFTLIAFPDTQNYTVNDGGAAIFNAQTQWVADHQMANNIIFATHLGDITENGDYDVDQSEWEIASNAMKILERDTSDPTDDVPFSVSKGNHDINSYSNYFEQYFGVLRFSGRPYYGGHFGLDNTNSYSRFTASGMHFIVINLAYEDDALGPKQEVLNWADGLLKDDVSQRGIVVLHDLMDDVDIFSQSGQAVYDALKDNPNLFLMLCGHYLVGQRTDTGMDEHPIYTLMSDYQYNENGGDGWLRLMEFQPAKNIIKVKTFSPTRNNGAGDYQTDNSNQFALDYPMHSPDFVLLNTVSVPSGSDVSITWSGLSNNTQYEWYAAARDMDTVILSAVRSFTTQNGQNNAPIAVQDSYTTDEDTPLNISAPGVLVNDTDVENNSLTVSHQANPAHGTLKLNSDGSFTYDPDPDYWGADSFTYQAYDGMDYSLPATVKLTVAAVNDAPEAANDTATTAEDTPVAIAVLNNDYDTEQDPLMIDRVTSSLHGTAVLQVDGRVLYTPDARYYGLDSFRYYISDGHGGTAEAGVSITVAHTNHAPVLANIANQKALKGALLRFTAAATDADLPMDTLTYLLSGCEELKGADIQPLTGVFTWTPGTGQRPGSYACTVCVSDGAAEACQTTRIALFEAIYLPFISN